MDMENMDPLTFYGTEKLYRLKTPFLERPIVSNTPCNYAVKMAVSPYDIVVGIQDKIGLEFEARLKALLAQYGALITDAKKLTEMMVIDAQFFYVGMPVLVKQVQKVIQDGAEVDVCEVYRGEVLAIQKDDMLDILLVDVGGVIEQHKQEVFPVTVELLRIPKLGIPCRMAHIRPDQGAESWAADRNWKKDFEGAKSQVVTFLDFYPDSKAYEVVLEVDGINMAIRFFHLSVAQPVPVALGPPNPVLVSVVGAYPVADYGAWIGLKVIVYGIKLYKDARDGKIRCVLQMEPEVVNKMQEQIASYVETATDAEKLAPFEKKLGSPCLALFGGEWYRATILNKEPGDKYLVEYVDYKERQVVSADEMLKIPADFLKTGEGATTCQLTDLLAVPDFQDLDALKALIEEKDLYAVVDACDPQMFGLDLLVSLFKPADTFNGPDTAFVDILSITQRPTVVREILQMTDPVTPELGSVFLGPVEPVPSKFYPGAACNVSVINSWESIWYQYEDGFDVASNLSAELVQYYANGGCLEEIREEFLQKPMPAGTMIVAKQPDASEEEMDLLFRCKVLGEEEGGNLRVRFIDYGNEETVVKAEVYPLHSYFLKNPVLAFEMALKWD